MDGGCGRVAGEKSLLIVNLFAIGESTGDNCNDGGLCSYVSGSIRGPEAGRPDVLVDRGVDEVRGGGGETEAGAKGGVCVWGVVMVEVLTVLVEVTR